MMGSAKKLVLAFGEYIKRERTTNFSVEKLCKEAGVHPQTFYYCFESKQDFLTFSLELFFSHLIYSPKEKSITELNKFYDSIIKMSDKKKDFAENIFFNGPDKEIVNEYFYRYLSNLFSKLSKKLSKENKVILFGAVIGVMLYSSYKGNELDSYLLATKTLDYLE
ncbi:MAG TPA: hypothetical protein DEF61_02710 [Firmicutes bacterium]|nr:hypothetical protein [Bacillota bacterium]HBX25174.1 hypothetical protein [Bacillota bacterium]